MSRPLRLSAGAASQADLAIRDPQTIKSPGSLLSGKPGSVLGKNQQPDAHPAIIVALNPQYIRSEEPHHPLVAPCSSPPAG
jgi:hypothetical protein